jgi:hypothetical protein
MKSIVNISDTIEYQLAGARPSGVAGPARWATAGDWAGVADESQDFEKNRTEPRAKSHDYKIPPDEIC